MQAIRQPHGARHGQILNAVARLVTTRGMNKVTINDIAREIGVTEAAIYRHFSSKRQILSSVIAQWRANLLGTVQSDPNTSVPALDTLERAFWNQLSEVENRRAMAFIVIAQAISFEGAGLGVEVASVIGEYLDTIRRILARGLLEGSVRPELDLDAAATTYFGMIQSTATLWALNDYAPPFAEAGANMWEIFKRGIACRA